MRSTNRLTAYLGGTLVFLGICYMVLIVTTVFFATLRTQYATNVQDQEASVGVLEDHYLAALASVQSADTVALGYTAPVSQNFVTAPEKPALTLVTTGE